MDRSNIRTTDANFVETPHGIFTASGTWFATTRDALETYAGDVLAHESIETLIQRAVVWIRSPESLAIWILPIAMLAMPPFSAVLATAASYIAWKTLGPSAVSRSLQRLFAVLDHVWLQGAYYVGVLSYFAAIGEYNAVWIGLLGFILVRWGILSRIVQPLVQRMQQKLYPLPVPDQVLRGFIVRTAMAYRVSLPELDQMERQIVDIFRGRK